MEKQAKVSPAVTLEAVTVPLADGRRGVVSVSYTHLTLPTSDLV